MMLVDDDLCVFWKEASNVLGHTLLDAVGDLLSFLIPKFERLLITQSNVRSD